MVLNDAQFEEVIEFLMQVYDVMPKGTDRKSVQARVRAFVNANHVAIAQTLVEVHKFIEQCSLCPHTPRPEKDSDGSEPDKEPEV